MDFEVVACDFDGTLTPAEVIDRLAVAHGVGEDVAAITEAAMAGTIPYPESLRTRVALLEGLDVETVDTVIDAIALRPGVASTIARLRADGVHVAVITGSFDRAVTRVLDRHGVGVDTIIANYLEVADGLLTGTVHGPLVDGSKGAALRDRLEAMGPEPAQVLVVGDGANDVAMFDVAGLAVCIDPARAVEPHCDRVIDAFPDVLAYVDGDAAGAA